MRLLTTLHAFVFVLAGGCAASHATWVPVRDAPALAAAVRAETQHAWAAYRRHAWGHDELLPLSRAGRDWHKGSLLMTPVDALDTLLIMHLDTEANEARALIDKELSFDQDISVKTFEITIRLLGGLLSAYQMTDDRRLLELATDLGRRLAPAFNSPTGMPYTNVNLRTGAVSGPHSNPAEIGTLILEFGTLSRLTHDPHYYELAKRALRALWQRRSPIGLVGEEIDVESGRWISSIAHISGGIDSYYEYLVKGARLFDDAELATMAKEMLAAVNRYLADETPSGLWYGYVNMDTGKRTDTLYGALDAFYPAVLVLAGDDERAARLQASSYRMWRVAGLEPEVYDYRAERITAPGYQLRPEIIESAYYLYHRTRDPQYREMGRTFLRDIERYCRTDDGYAAISDVRDKSKRDRMESYFFAETLKYLYLLFAPDKVLPLADVVFNTEAHPLRRVR